MERRKKITSSRKITKKVTTKKERKKDKENEANEKAENGINKKLSYRRATVRRAATLKTSAFCDGTSRYGVTENLTTG